MSRDVAELFLEASRLSEADRAELAGRILQSLHGERKEGVEEEEIERRIRQIDSGEVQTIPWEDVRAKLHARLHGKS